jgi:antitoxin (DNA-binding transcriptional repressor) of toxin-antitoxin stability system
MARAVTATELRQQIYKLLDEVLESGEPLEVVRKGRRLRVIADEAVDPLGRITPIPGLIVGDPERLADLDWSDEWDPGSAIDP